jgi:Holliday junction resolvase RusA-like endonuclease
MGAKLKRDEMERIMWQLPSDKLEGRINITFRAFVKDKRKDPDNTLLFFTKCCLDSMVKKGMIENDGQKQIGRITFEPVEIGEPRVEVIID